MAILSAASHAHQQRPVAQTERPVGCKIMTDGHSNTDVSPARAAWMQLTPQPQTKKMGSLREQRCSFPDQACCSFTVKSSLPGSVTEELVVWTRKLFSRKEHSTTPRISDDVHNSGHPDGGAAKETEHGGGPPAIFSIRPLRQRCNLQSESEG